MGSEPTQTAVQIESLTKEELEARGVTSWPIWEKEVSQFDWTYDSQEQCYFLEGEVTITTDQGTTEIKPGDFVTFPKGLSCVWNVKVPVRKHYQFE